MSDEFNESLLEQSRALFHHAELPDLSYENYRAIVSQAGNVYLQLLRDYLANVPDEAVSDRAITIGNLMVEIQELLL